MVRVRVRVRVTVRVWVDEELAVGVVLVEGGEGGVDGALGETEGAQADAHLGRGREM